MHQHTCTHHGVLTQTRMHAHTQLEFGSLESFLTCTKPVSVHIYLRMKKSSNRKTKQAMAETDKKKKKWGREETKAETPCYSYLCKLFEFGGWIPGRGDHDLGILHHGPSVLVILTGCQTCRRVSTQHARCAQSTHSTVCSVNS